MGISRPDNLVRGLEIMLWGQLAASALTYIISLAYTARYTHVAVKRFILDMLPYLAQTLLIIPFMSLAAGMADTPWLKLALEIITGLGLYIGGNCIFKFSYIRRSQK